MELTPNTFDERPQLACDGDYRGQASIVLLEMTPTFRQGATFVRLGQPPHFCGVRPAMSGSLQLGDPHHVLDRRRGLPNPAREAGLGQRCG